MARAAWQAPDPVAGPHAPVRPLGVALEDCEFYDALRRLECLHADRPRLGQSTKAGEDAVRLRQTPSLSFVPREIDRYEPATAGQPASLYALFFGLFGPEGPLPLHLTEYAIDRQINGRDRSFTAFADVFHHRMLSLYYRAWADAQPAVQADRPEALDRFTLYSGALVGLAGEHLRARDALPDQFKRFFSGRLQQQSRNTEGLKCLLEEFFHIPIAVVEFVAEWMRLPADSHLRLGAAPHTGVLGETAVLGAYVQGAQHRFRLRLGPMSLDRFRKFLPGSEALAQLVAAVKTYVGEAVAWEVQLILDRHEVPATTLGKSGRLGYTTWMAPPAFSLDADDVVLRPVG